MTDTHDADDDETVIGVPADDVETADEEQEEEAADAWVIPDGDPGGGW
ncbi:hypothetical protein G3I40_27795 [Streptomyces sp. SID14478]|nr:hypothetical protein [Streptomyces sp. SID14478]NEB78993.1 hypothetical protein [Streptomyces sp. SID14478]